MKWFWRIERHDSALLLTRDAQPVLMCGHLRSLASVQKKLAMSGRPMSTNTFAIQVEPPTETKRQPQSEFFTARLNDKSELPWPKIRALASIGAGLLMRHLDDPKAIDKMGRLLAARLQDTTRS